MHCARQHAGRFGGRGRLAVRTRKPARFPAHLCCQLAVPPAVDAGRGGTEAASAPRATIASAPPEAGSDARSGRASMLLGPMARAHGCAFNGDCSAHARTSKKLTRTHF